jgi:hypothetical protein
MDPLISTGDLDGGAVGVMDAAPADPGDADPEDDTDAAAASGSREDATVDVRPEVDAPVPDPDGCNGAVAPRNGLVSYYSFDQIDVVSDINGVHGAAKGVVWKAGRQGLAVAFVPASSPEISVPSYFANNIGPAVTVAAWVRAVEWTGQRRIVQKGGAVLQYGLFVDSGKLEFAVTTGATITADTSAPPADRWVHVAGSYDGAMVRIFVNGVQVGSTRANGPIKMTDGDLFFGTASSTSPESERWNGLIDEVALYARALGPAEIKALACGAVVR